MTRRFFMILTGTLAVAGGLAIISASRERSMPDLLVRSRRIAAFQGGWYEWAAPTKVAAWGFYPRPQHPTPRDLRSVLLDIYSGQIQPIVSVNRDLSTVFDFNDGASFDTDGAWVLVAGGRMRQDKARWIQLGRHGIEREWLADVPGLRVSPPVWKPDIQRWVYISARSELGKGLTGFRTVTVGRPERAAHTGGMFPIPARTAYWDSIGCNILGFRPNGRVVALPLWSCFDSRRDNGLRLFEVDVEGAANLREYVVPIDGDRHILSAALNPRGESLALVSRRYYVPEVSWMHRFMGRWWPNMIPKPELLTEVLTVGLDGRGLKVVGKLPDTRDDRGVDTYRIRWLPDGKQLSFVESNKLYVVHTEVTD